MIPLLIDLAKRVVELESRITADRKTGAEFEGTLMGHCEELKAAILDNDENYHLRMDTLEQSLNALEQSRSAQVARTDKLEERIDRLPEQASPPVEDEERRDALVFFGDKAGETQKELEDEKTDHAATRKFRRENWKLYLEEKAAHAELLREFESLTNGAEALMKSLDDEKAAHAKTGGKLQEEWDKGKRWAKELIDVREELAETKKDYAAEQVAHARTQSSLDAAEAKLARVREVSE